MNRNKNDKVSNMADGSHIGLGQAQFVP